MSNGKVLKIIFTNFEESADLEISRVLLVVKNEESKLTVFTYTIITFGVCANYGNDFTVHDVKSKTVKSQKVYAHINRKIYRKNFAHTWLTFYDLQLRIFKIQ
jgi:hypothetical protein